jgi:hypothetical protein
MRLTSWAADVRKNQLKFSHRQLLYYFDQFDSHASQPFFADTGNNFFSILPVFGDLSEKLKKSHAVELIEMVQYFEEEGERKEE